MVPWITCGGSWISRKTPGGGTPCRAVPKVAWLAAHPTEQFLFCHTEYTRERKPLRNPQERERDIIYMAYRYHIGRGVLRRGYTKAFHVNEQQDSYISQALTIAKRLIAGWEKEHEDNE